MSSSPQRALPAVEKLVQALGPLGLPRPLVVHHARRFVSELRTAGTFPAFEEVAASLRARLESIARSRLQGVVNATGILAHTNLGRAPLGRPAIDALTSVAGRYSNLEFDLDSGERGSRGAYLESVLALVCDAPAATVVNNCAAALVLIVRHLTAGERKEVVISRGELVQIGGGFRIPDILVSSGARLREVGTTNRTTVADYRQALGSGTALVLRVHPSNFYMEGFVESPATADLAALARDHGIPFVEDLGSGAIVDTAAALTRPRAAASSAHEPQPPEILRAGADLVCFSGDKLLGGPQAGLIVGREDLVRDLKRDPLFRALRCDKLVFAALQATLEAYLDHASRKDLAPPPGVPLLALMAVTLEALRARAQSLLDRCRTLPAECDLAETQSRIGGGVCPRITIPSIALRVRPHDGSVDSLANRLRRGLPPVVGFVADGHLQLDLRTVFPDQDEVLVDALHAALSAEVGTA